MDRHRTLRLVTLLLVVLVAGLLVRDVQRTRAEYRRETVQARTIERQQRFIDGLAEQADQLEDEVARLQTAVADAVAKKMPVKITLKGSKTVLIGTLEKM